MRRLATDTNPAQVSNEDVAAMAECFPSAFLQDAEGG